ncbi:MAG: aspartate--tRNA ligase [Candidatus Woesearchaeota archaeon]
MEFSYRTHTCGELTAKDNKKEVILSGWIHNLREHGNVVFIDLRDRYGLTQLSIDKKIVDFNLKKESVILAKGEVVLRPTPNKNISTGEIELNVSSLSLINMSDTLPINNEVTEDPNLRLKYRYIDLRRQSSISKLELRHNVKKAAANFFNKNNFLEIETPLLVKSTPEGARDYLVPSRVNKGKFYALPQSPQLYKQILMIAGVDRYYQFARCLRDEDLRADRQPEHTQMDFEISFAKSKDIMDFTEGLFKHIFQETLNIKLDDFKRFTYEEAMSRFGSDKPDLRFGLELNNITELAKKSEFKVFKEAESVNCIVVPKTFSRKEIDKLTEFVKIYGAKGLAYVQYNNGFESGVSKFLEGIEAELVKKLNIKKDSTIFFVADKKKITQTSLGQLRLKLRDELNLADPNDFKFCFVTDFPLFSFNEDENRWEPEHHMFSMPKEEFVDDFEKRPGEVKGDLFDVALNGWELGSGSIRVSNPGVQKRIMKFIGIDEEEANQKFGFLLEAYNYGAPTHGGMGLGLDRLVALMVHTTDIREVISFPKNKNAECPMDDSPSPIEKGQLDELGLKLK